MSTESQPRKEMRRTLRARALSIYIVAWVKPSNAICRPHRQAAAQMIRRLPATSDAFHFFVARNAWATVFATEKCLRRMHMRYAGSIVVGALAV